MIGTRLRHYDIVEKLGEGGMGMVFKARDASLDRFVAIKVLPPDKLANAERKQRFIREAKAASALNHPNIITIHEIGEQDGADYIVMEYIPGCTLERMIVRGGMRLSDILRIAVPVADALARAHAAGIIHRDLKPGNIMVGDDGLVKLLDFGLAKLTELDAASEVDVTRTVQQHTEEGTVLGTVAYMSPEQAEARKVDTRSDIFSFGVVLYEMATGQRPFAGASKLSTLAAILHVEPKAPHEIAAAVAPAFERIIVRCLRKDPAWRYQSAADLKVSLAELELDKSSGGERTVAVPKPRRRLPRWIAPLAAGFLLGLAPAWWWIGRAPSKPPAPYLVRPLTTYAGLEQEPSLSPDGNQVAFSWNGEKKDNFDIYVRLVDGGASLRLTSDAAPDRAPTWSPDGRRIAFVRRRAVFTVPALGGTERQIVRLPESRFGAGPLSWSADGRYLAFAAGGSGASQVHLVTADTGELRLLPAAPAGWNGDYTPAFSPDGRTLAFSRRKDLFSHAILVQNLDADAVPRGSPRQITPFTLTVNQLVWMPTGQGLVASITRSSLAALFRVTLAGELQPLGIESGSATWPALSRAGNRLAYEKTYSDSNVWMLDGPGPDGGPRPYENSNPHAVIDSTASDREPRLSPDGARLGFTSYRGGSSEVYVANADGTNQEAITSVGPRFAGSPRWSPDGLHIAFDRYVDGHSSIYVVRAQGGKARPVTSGTASHSRPSWSRDGKWIYYTSNETGTSEVWKIAWNGGADPGKPVRMTHAGGTEAFESPDGSELLFNVEGDLWSMPAGGGEPKLILPEVLAGQWVAVGRSIYYLTTSPRAVWVLRRDTGRKFEYLRFPGTAAFGSGSRIDVSADERRIYFTQIDRVESDLMLVENFR